MKQHRTTPVRPLTRGFSFPRETHSQEVDVHVGHHPLKLSTIHFSAATCAHL